jgi:hypothetical protein
MANWLGRAGRWPCLWLAAVLAVLGVGSVAPRAAAGGVCDGRVFAVDSDTGHLVEIPFCPDTSSFGSAVEVDSADWRGYSAIFAVRDGGAAILYAVTASGELWWRRQPTAGAALSAPARVGSSINWNQPVVFASRPGYLHLGYHGAPIRTFRHQEWAAGGAAVWEEANLFAPLRGPSITGLATGFAFGIWNGISFRVWRMQQRSMRWDEDVWYISGYLPAGLTSVVGDGYRLHAVNSAGEIVLLAQVSGEPPPCNRPDTRPWEVTARAPGHYLRVVVPVSDAVTGPRSVTPPPPVRITDCEAEGEGNPWEWQITGS